MATQPPTEPDWLRLDSVAPRDDGIPATLPQLDSPPGPVDTTEPTAEGPAQVAAVPGYEILGELGRGGMGVVYRARQKGLNRLVALKMIRSGVTAGEEALARFRAEAAAVARLQHPNVVQVYEVGEFEGLPYFSLEFVRGGSLDRYLKGQPQPPRDAAALAATLADAMHAAHQAGIVHRDLKPANVLLGRPPSPQPPSPFEMGKGGPDKEVPQAASGSPSPYEGEGAGGWGRPKIADFGLAKQLDVDSGRTREGHVLGTPSYMAPEQAEGRQDRISPRTDVYALGAILYECLTGRPPFQGVTPMETVFLVIATDPVAPRRLQPRVPRDLETIALKCLEKAPEKRYPTAQDLAADLRRFLAGEPIRARPVGRPERAWRWCRRNPLAAGLGAAAAAALGLLLGAGAWWAQERAARAVAEARRQAEVGRMVHGALQEAQDLAAEARKDGAAAKWNEAVARARGAQDVAQAEGAEAELGRQTAALIARLERDRDAARAAEEADRRRRDQDRQDQQLRDRLEAILIQWNGSVIVANPARQRVQQALRGLFREAGLDLDRPPQEGAARYQGRAVAADLAFALDLFAALNRAEGQTAADGRPLALAQSLDPDPARDGLRAAWVAGDKAALLARAQAVPLDGPPVQTLLLTALVLCDADEQGAAALAFLRKAQWRYPNHAWLNHLIAGLLRQQKPRPLADILRYRLAALAAHPSAVAYYNLGLNLRNLDRWDEAAEAFRQTLRLEPRSALSQRLLAQTLLALDPSAPEAVAECRAAAELTPGQAPPLMNLGEALLEAGQLAEAARVLEQCQALVEQRPQGQARVPVDLIRQRRAWCQALLAADARVADALAGRTGEQKSQELVALAERLRTTGHPEAAVPLYQAAFAAAPDLVPQFRLAAARAAGRAGAAPDAAHRPYRDQALAWLRDELAAHPDLPPLAEDSLAASPSVGAVVLSDSAFRAVREPATLAKLPADERTAWEQFWRSLREQRLREGR